MITHAQTKHWTVKEYRRLLEDGILPHDAQVELIGGELVEMARQNDAHAVMSLSEHLLQAFKDTHRVAWQVNLEMSDTSDPICDFCVIPRSRFRAGQSYRDADLIVEISDTTLSFDRHEKAGLYAGCWVPEYWILNLRNRQLEVHRQPHPRPGAPFGHAWGTVERVPESDTVSPLCRPDIILKVADLF